MRLALIATYALLVGTACGFDVTAEDLVGTWLNGDDGISRTIVFGADASYEIIIDGSPTQSGSYAVMDDTLVNTDAGETELDNVLVWTVGWDANGTPAGTAFGDPIYDYTGTELELRSATSSTGSRVFTLSE